MKLLRRPGLQRVIASFLLVELLHNILSPSLAVALTSGPASPDVASFEPVDTTDMVNLNSGDFVYNLPLLEVPGPEGGYPLSLAYHAGIELEEEASWVGLGWSLNPGAINRTVNGFADDQKKETQYSRYYWKGGRRSTYEVGVTVGIGNSASVGLSYSNDTFLGNSVGGWIGGSLGFKLAGGDDSSLGLGVGATASTDGYGNSSINASVGLSLGKSLDNGLNGSVGVGLATNFKSIDGYASADLNYDKDGNSKYNNHNSYSLLGASMSSHNNGSVGVSVGGASRSVRNDKAGNISIHSDGGRVNIPIKPGLSLTLGCMFQRYWSDETTAGTVNGTLYFPENMYSSNTNFDITSLDNITYDVVRLLEPDADISVHNDPDWLQGGSLPNYDSYLVTAQGVSGRMRPYAHQLGLYGRNRKNSSGSNYEIMGLPLRHVNKRMNFRFEGDFSNAFRQDNGNDYRIARRGTYCNALNNSDGSTSYPYVEYPFDDQPSIDNNDGIDGYDPVTDKLAGSQSVEWFTNNEIANGTARAAGFVDTRAAGFTRPTSNPPAEGGPGFQIGGFMITNASGVTYHYALPAYASEEYQRSEQIGGPTTFNESTKNAPYAYSWFLTAVTGPDYVDIDQDGLASDRDWGYWVAFGYGRWASRFPWRTPFRGYTEDIDGRFKNFATGLREVYYLNTISTRTHVAAFEKSFRADAKSCPDTQYASERDREVVEIKKTCGGSGCFYDMTVAKPSLRLNRILLFDKRDGERLLQYNGSELVDQASVFNVQESNGSDGGPTGNIQLVVRNRRLYGNHVIDSADIARAITVNPGFLSRAIKVIKFNYSYSLCPNTPNSFDPQGLLCQDFITNGILTGGNSGTGTFYPYPSGWSIPPRLGKLTLKSVDFLGQGGTYTTPPILFDYELGQKEKKKAQITAQAVVAPPQQNAKQGVIEQDYGASTTISQLFQKGDILRFLDPATDKAYYAFVMYPTNRDATGYSPTDVAMNASITVRYLGDFPTSNLLVPAEQTKNPPYTPEAYDMWGLFKGDYDPQLTRDPEMRLTTEASSKSTDVWSLRRITTATGANICVNYESDDYLQPVFYKDPEISCLFSLVPVDVSSFPGATADITIDWKPERVSELFSKGDKFRITCVKRLYDGSVWYTYHKKVNATFLNSTPVVVGADIKTRISFAEESHPYKIVPLSGTTVYLSCGYLERNRADAVRYGGGIRVKNLLVESNNIVKHRFFDYKPLVHTGRLSSGTTTLEPKPLPVHGSGLKTQLQSASAYHSIVDNYLSDLYSAFPDFMVLSQIAPSPGVMYKHVSMSESVWHKDHQESSPFTGRTEYEFEVFDKNMFGVRRQSASKPGSGVFQQTFTSTSTNEWFSLLGLYTTEVDIKDFTSRLGNLRRATVYDELGRKTHEITNEYLHDPLRGQSFEANAAETVGGYEAMLAPYQYQGVVQERFGDSRLMLSNQGGGQCQGASGTTVDWKVVMTRRSVFPNIQTSNTVVDYLNGTKTTTRNLEYDFYSGALLKTHTVDAYGNQFLSVGVPAYRFSDGGTPATMPYAQMGPKLSRTDGRKNMLTQQAASYVYRAETIANAPRATQLISGSATVWANEQPVQSWEGDAVNNSVLSNNKPITQTGVWRPSAMYAWLPSGTGGPAAANPANDYLAFHTANAPAGWRKTTDITRYDVFSHPLEERDFNGLYAATRLIGGLGQVMVTGAPARLNEITYCGAEELVPVTEAAWPNNVAYSGNVFPRWTPNSGAGTPPTTTTAAATTTRAHTGQYSIQLSPGQHGFSYSLPLDGTVDLTRSYRAMVWVTSTGASPSGTGVNLYCEKVVGGQKIRVVQATVTPSISTTTGNSNQKWYPIELVIPSLVSAGDPQPTSVRIACENTSSANRFIDDFRVQPLEAATNAYGYDPVTGKVSWVLDNNNFFTRYVYDAAGRLKETWQESVKYGEKRLSQAAYAYARTPNPLTGMTLNAVTTGYVTPAPGNARTTVSLVLPATVTTTPTITYQTVKLTGGQSVTSPWQTASGPSFFVDWATAGGYWLKVRVQDVGGQQQDFVRYINVN